ncbi:MAG: hypothetical protein MJZ70_05400 [Bacteroidales bacterium]|nr:hypothetical protein [Bacteroidales bacterium]
MKIENYFLPDTSLAAKKQGRDDIDVVVEYIGGGSVNISYRGVTEQW